MKIHVSAKLFAPLADQDPGTRNLAVMTYDRWLEVPLDAEATVNLLKGRIYVGANNCKIDRFYRRNEKLFIVASACMLKSSPGYVEELRQLGWKLNRKGAKWHDIPKQKQSPPAPKAAKLTSAGRRMAASFASQRACTR